MIKTKLPVIVLRNLILLPSGEIRLEISNSLDKKVISKSIEENDSYLLLISPEYIFDEEIDIDDLPKYGTIGKITSNFDLPNDNMRISIIGINRAKIYEYSNPNESGQIIDATIGPFIIEEEEDTVETEAKLRLLKSKFSSYVLSYILREKIKVIKTELGDISDKDEEIDEIRTKITLLNTTKDIKDKLLKELKKYESMPSTSPEIAIVKNYIDTFLSLPFGIYTNDNTDLRKIEKELNKSHFGLKDVKNRILEYISVKQLTSNLKSPIICLIGPPGVGKTSLAFSIANALNRNFVKISVGGISDENEIIGHRRTYVGAEPGRIINAIKKAKSMNPLFLIDEIDKMTKDIKGDPASSLLEVLDPEQNNLFTDNFLEEPFDLSKVMFILTANDINGIPYALRDRLEIINLSSYTEFEKVDIVNNYMFEKLLKEHGLTKSNLIMNNDIIKYIIEYYTKEAGVRELERVLSSLMRKVAKKKVETKKNSRVKITKDNIYDYLGKEKYSHIENEKALEDGVVNALAYTPFGGEIIPLEVTYYKGKGNIILTGSLGRCYERKC